ncbi:MAG: peptide chain release factor 2 [Deltaproteobacteria bacterium]|nr:peptide chain release factor 2 [Deltaproteobacteria bacterium]
MLAELKEKLAELDARVENLGRRLDIAGKEARAAELDALTTANEFWQDQEKAQAILKERATLTDVITQWKKHARGLDDAHVFFEMAEAGDPEAAAEVEKHVAELEKEVSEAEMQRMLGGEHDAGNAIVSLHPGAGGLEAQDWAEMLLRLYLRWAERKGYKVEMADYVPGEGGGVKSATFTVEGPYAYGYLQAEAGIHRLVRISPFDANARRHTSFASVFVYPDLDDTVEVDIRPEDLRIDTYRSGGAGGQHVNKTDSAVRLTHLPTGIVVTCQNERSQHRNRTMAMKILRAKLYEVELEKQKEKMEDLHKSKKEIAWGSQIRSYVLHPYRMVKDHRTGVEVGNTDAVLDGEIDAFIEAYLRQRIAA